VEQIVQLMGALRVLTGFALAQLDRLDHRSGAYILINLVGSALLAGDATVDAQFGFLLLGNAWSHVDLETWGWASRPRPIAPGYEVALFIPTAGAMRVVTEPTLVRGLPLVMHHTDYGSLFAGQQGDERWAPDIPPA
jgi:hypothetical protein